MLVTLAFIVGLSLGFLTWLALQGFFYLPNLNAVENHKETSVLYDDQGNVLERYCKDYCREAIPLSEMGNFVKVAVAVEDKSYWGRWFLPVDFFGSARAFVQNWRAGRVQQGASTILQQVSGILVEETDKEELKTHGQWWRKGRKVWIATVLWLRLDRKHVLELYLNNIYCGHNQRGVKACSDYYYGRGPAELTLAETIPIALTWRSPGSSPFLNKDRALRGRERVLEQLKNQGIITAVQKNEMQKAPLPTRVARGACDAQHFAEFIRRQLTRTGKLVDEGLKIDSTLDCGLQTVTSRALKHSMEDMIARNFELADDLRGLAVITAHTGAIKAFVQEPEFTENQQLADQIIRQAGSTFKPIFYAAWLKYAERKVNGKEIVGGRLSSLDEGRGPARLDDSYQGPGGASRLWINMGRKKGAKFIHNFDPPRGIARYNGISDAIQCLARSLNACTMSGVEGVHGSRADAQISKEQILEMAKLLRIPPSGVDPGLTVAIGSLDVPPLAMLRAIATFVSGDIVEPYAIEELRHASGITTHRASIQKEKVLDDNIALAMLRGLRATVEFPRGTAKSAKVINADVMCKTGTATNTAGESTDNWIVCSTPSYHAVVWIGRKEKLPMPNTVGPDGEKIQETGGRNALRVFIEAMKSKTEGLPREKFPEATNPLQPFSPSRQNVQEEKDDATITSENNGF